MIEAGTPTSAPTSAPTSTFEDLIDIWYKPAAVFARRHPLGFWLPFILVTVIVGAISWFSAPVMQPIYEAMFDQGMAKQMASNPRMTPEMLASARASMTRFFPIFAVVGTPFRLLALGVALWVCGKLVSAKESFGTALAITAFASLPRIIEALVYAVQAAVMDPTALKGPTQLMISPARFLDPSTTSMVLVNLLARIDLFAFWVLAIAVIGLSVKGNVSRKQAAVVGVVLWVLGTAVGLLGALRMGS
jgi:hypothetical protein